MYAFNNQGHFQVRNRDDFHRYINCVLGGRESLGDLIITERDSPETIALKQARQRSISAGMCQHLGG